MNDTQRPGVVTALMVLIAVQAVGAIGGGVGLVHDPVDNIGLSPSLLEGTPFQDYLIPGPILLIIVGIFPLIALVGLVRGGIWGCVLALARPTRAYVQVTFAPPRESGA